MGGLLEPEESETSKQIDETQEKAAKAIAKMAKTMIEQNEAKAKAVADKTQDDNATTSGGDEKHNAEVTPSAATSENRDSHDQLQIPQPETTASIPIKTNQETQETDKNNIITTNHKIENENQQINPSNDHVPTALNYWNFGTINIIDVK